MNYVRGFIPWIAFAVVSSAGWQWGAVAGLVAGAGLLVQERKAGAAGSSLILEVSTVCFFAALAGCLLTQFQQQYSDALFSPAESFNVFTSAVVGGLGSMAGGLIGALFLWGGKWWLQNPSFPPLLYLLPSAIGVLVVLLVLPGGLSGAVYRLRDRCRPS